MKALALDLRGPLLVVAGAFNPAIFSQSWIATNVFDIPLGAEMSVLEAIIQVDPQTLMRLAFINGVAINAAASRLELFAIDGAEATFTTVEQALARILALLPHTPIAGIGCNLRWRDADPSPESLDLFESPEGLEGRYPVHGRQYLASVEIDGRLLNLARANVGAEIQYSFNYHRTVEGAAECSAILDGLIMSDLNHSVSAMDDLYGYKDHIKLTFGEDQAVENGDAADNED